QEEDGIRDFHVTEFRRVLFRSLMREDAAWIAEQGLQQAQRMHREVVQRAVTGTGFALPIEERFRVGHEILVHLDTDMVHSANNRSEERGVGEERRRPATTSHES